MNRSIIVAFALASLVVGCKKKDTAATTGSAAPAGSAAAPSGSAAGSAAMAGSGMAGSAEAGSAAAGSAAAGSAAGSAAAAPTPDAPAGQIILRRGAGKDSTYDANKALYYKKGAVRAIVVPSNCDKLTCALIGKDGLDDEKYFKACPSGMYATIKFFSDSNPGEPKVGPVKADVSMSAGMSGGGVTSDFVDGSSLTEVSDKEIKGKIDANGGTDYFAKGEFTAKVCK